MKIQLQKLISTVYPALSELSTLDVSPRLTLNIVKSKRACQESLKDFDESKVKIIETHCRKNEQGESVKTPAVENGMNIVKYEFETPADEETCKNKIGELLAEEVDVNMFPLPIDEITGINANVKPIIVEALMGTFFIEMEVVKASENGKAKDKVKA